jgi:hypothetical protein
MAQPPLMIDEIFDNHVLAIQQLNRMLVSIENANPNLHQDIRLNEEEHVFDTGEIHFSQQC